MLKLRYKSNKTLKYIIIFRSYLSHSFSSEKVFIKLVLTSFRYLLLQNYYKVINQKPMKSAILGFLVYTHILLAALYS